HSWIRDGPGCLPHRKSSTVVTFATRLGCRTVTFACWQVSLRPRAGDRAWRLTVGRRCGHATSTRTDRLFDFLLGGLQWIVGDVDSSILDAYFLNSVDRVQPVRDRLFVGRRSQSLA